LDIISDIEEMYLKCIFEVHNESPGAIVKTNQLANLMDISAASATEMIQKLSDKKLLTHIPYKGCRLTPDGFQIAAKIKRREGLLQILLSEVIGYSGDFVSVACKMEHAVNDELELALDEFLGYPEMTSDGTKIPALYRNIAPIGIGTLLPIDYIPLGFSAEVESILSNESDSVTISDFGLKVGSKIDHFDDGFICDGNRLEFSKVISTKIIVRLTDKVGG